MKLTGAYGQGDPDHSNFLECPYIKQWMALDPHAQTPDAKQFKVFI